VLAGEPANQPSAGRRSFAPPFTEIVKKALDQKTQEAESLRAECERLRAQQAEKQ